MKDIFSIKGKVALVTGGSRGIGSMIAAGFLSSGAKVYISSRKADACDETAKKLSEEYGGECISIPADVSNVEGIEALADAIKAKEDKLDILINNAGTAATTEPIPFENLEMITEERWQQIIHTNVIGPFRCSRMAASTLKERKGCIVNTASIAGIGNAGSSIAYSNSKAAIISQTRCLARALAPEIRVNAVAPGLTRTAWTDPWNDEGKQVSIEASLLKRMVEPEDIAQGMLFLVVNPAITGQTIVIDNGRLPT